MSEGVSEQTVGGIVILTLDAGSTGGLTAPLRTGLLEAFQRIETAGTARAVVLAARGRSFPASAPDDGQDPPEELRAPDASELMMRVEGSGVPVFAAMHGTVTGLGLELGLAAHYRITDRRTRLGFPGLDLGLLPVAGGVQRLCRAVGPVLALDLLLTGRLLEAAEAREAGLVDHVADGPLPKFTLGVVRQVLDAGGGPRPIGRQDERLSARKRLSNTIGARRYNLVKDADSAKARAFDCVEAALLLPYEAALGAERAVAEDLRSSAPSRALRHVHRAMLDARRPPVSAPVPTPEITHVGVIGAGQIGRGIAPTCLCRGLSVSLVERSIDLLEQGVEHIIDAFGREIDRGRMDEGTRKARLAGLKGSVDISSVAAADIVIEAVSEDADEKRRVFGALDTVMKRGAVLATTTASLDIDALAAGTSRSPDVLGLSLFPPVLHSQVMEVVIALDSSDTALATAWELARRLAMTAVPATVADGYVIRQVVGAARAAAELCLVEGASVAGVDENLRTLGLPIGVFEAWDLEGLDTPWSRDPGGAGLAARLRAAGRTGRRGGAGWYRYAPGKSRGQPAPDVERILTSARAEAGVRPSDPGQDGIRRRIFAAMANRGARLLAEGVARKPADIDLGLVLAMLLPRVTGGPMMAADQIGLLRVKRDLDAFRASAPGGAFWTAEPLLVALVKNGLTFEDLNRNPDRVRDLL